LKKHSKVARGGGHTNHGNPRAALSAHDIAMKDPEHTQLSNNQMINDHPARLMPPSPAGWGQSLDNNAVWGPGDNNL
jgi:hypothetical protein